MTLELAIGQQLLLRSWVSILCDHRLDLIFRDSIYHLHVDAYVNLIKQSVNVIRSKRSKIEIKFKIYMEPIAKSYWRRND